MQPLEQADFLVPCLVPCALQKQQPVLTPEHDDDIRGVKEAFQSAAPEWHILVVSKHMARTKFSSPHSWMALCTAWAIARHAVRSLECPTTSLPLLRQNGQSIHLVCTHQVYINLPSLCTANVVVGLKDSRTIHNLKYCENCRIAEVYGKLWGCWATSEY